MRVDHESNSVLREQTRSGTVNYSLETITINYSSETITINYSLETITINYSWEIITINYSWEIITINYSWETITINYSLEIAWENSNDNAHVVHCVHSLLKNVHLLSSLLDTKLKKDRVSSRVKYASGQAHMLKP